MLARLLENTWALYLDAAPWLLLGLVAAGLMRAFVREDRLARHLGGGGLGPVFKAALVGAPLPLCSCGVIPTALTLYRAGASRGATVSFLVATPETGVDSVAVSWALLGPFMTIARPFAALASAIAAGLLAGLVPQSRSAASQIDSSSCSCTGQCRDAATAPEPGKAARLRAGLGYAATDLVDDLAPWMAAGLLAAGLIVTLLPPDTLAAWGRGPFAMLVMLAIGVPMYICATASTPLAAALLVAGVSPGAVLVFLLAGPATNVATLALLRRELGTPVLVAYLSGIAAVSLIAGLLTDTLVDALAIDVPAQAAAAGEAVPTMLAEAAAIILAVLALRPLRRPLAALLNR